MQFVKFVAVAIAAALGVSAATTPLVARSKDIKADVYLIRHGEKIDDDHTGLSPRGEQRADCVENVFSQDQLKVDAIITQDYKSNGKRIRPYDTVKPLAQRLGLDIDHHCDRDDADCAAKAIKKAVDKGAKRVLVCWEHHALSDIAKEFGVKGLDYPDRFDLVWQINDGKLVRSFSEECPNLDGN